MAPVSEWERFAKEAHLASLKRRLEKHERVAQKRLRRRRALEFVGWLVLMIVAASAVMAAIYLAPR